MRFVRQFIFLAYLFASNAYSKNVHPIAKRLDNRLQPRDDGSFANTPSIEIYGNKFFSTVDGNQFFIKGIAYQAQRDMNMLESADGVFDTTYIDPLADYDRCLRDIQYLKELGINTIRVYAIDPNKNHDKCMAALASAGIYVLLDLSEPDISIVRNKPNWNNDLMNRYYSVVDAMHKYPNLLGFFAGNEVTNDCTNTDASPFVKAAIRDTKEYIKQKGYRNIPVGYSTNDDHETRDNLAQYFVCDDVSADFYGINMYEWCGYSSYGSSGYKERTEEFDNYPIPVFFSEFGCNLVRPRPFTEIRELFGPKMTPVWSGGIVYMYFEEENEYGVVRIDEKGDVIKLEDFDYLKKEYARVRPKALTLDQYKGSIHAPLKRPTINCPEKSSSWKASTILPPKPDKERCDCLEDILPCKVIPYDRDSINYEKYFEYLCGEIDCSDIVSDGEEGIYGEFSACSTDQKFSLELSKLYFKIGNNDKKCPIENDRNIVFNQGSLGNKKVSKKCQSYFDSIKQKATEIIEDKGNNDRHEYSEKNKENNGHDRKENSASSLIYKRLGINCFMLGAICFIFLI